MDGLVGQLIEHAVKSDMRIKLAAGLFYTKKGFVVIRSNSRRTYVNKTIKPNLHAEDAVIEYLKNRPNRMKTKHMKLMVVRVNNDDKLLLCRPCMNCTRTMSEMGIRKVYYSDAHGKIICERVCDIYNYYKKCPFVSSTYDWFNEMYPHRCISSSTQMYVNEAKTIRSFTPLMGKLVEDMRLHRNWNQDELAANLSITAEMVQQIEDGYGHYHSGIAIKLRKCFGAFSWCGVPSTTGQARCQA